VVAGTSGDAGEREIEFCGDGCHECLGAVATCGSERVGAVGDGGAHQVDQVVTGTQLDRFDPSGPSLGIEVGGKRLSAAGLGVPHHDRMSRSGSGGERHVDPKRRARCHGGQCEECGGDDRLEEDPADHEGDDEADGQQHAERSEPRRARRADPRRRRACQPAAREHQRKLLAVEPPHLEDLVDRHDQGRDERQGDHECPLGTGQRHGVEQSLKETGFHGGQGQPPSEHDPAHVREQRRRPGHLPLATHHEAHVDRAQRNDGEGHRHRRGGVDRARFARSPRQQRQRRTGDDEAADDPADGLGSGGDLRARACAAGDPSRRGPGRRR
jgi:hypothetical protein